MENIKMQMIIAGKHVDASDGGVVQNINPSTQKSIGTVPSATKQDIEKAVDTAVSAQREWAAVPLHERIEIIYKFEKLVAQNAEKIGRIACLEGGKLLAEAIHETKTMGYVFKVFAEGARNFFGTSFSQGFDPRIGNDIMFTRNEPLGVVLCIVPFNYPLELYAHKVAPALLMGNSVIIKPSTHTPMAAIMATDLLLQAGVTSGAVQIVTGEGSKVGNILTSNPKIAAISMTGSNPVARDIIKSSANHMPRLFFELGGNDPLIIFKDADLDLAVSESLVGRTINAGQICCCSKRFIVHNDIKEKYTQKLIEALKKYEPTDAIDPKAPMGPVVSKKAAENIIDQINTTIDQGATCAYGGTNKNAYVQPTVLTNVTPNMDVSTDMEIFGPVFPIIGFDTFDQAIEIANATQYGLQGGVITSNMKTALKAATKLACGCVVINGSGNYRSAHQPFGGYKQSGLGREGVTTTLQEMSQAKTIALKGVLD